MLDQFAESLKNLSQDFVWPIEPGSEVEIIEKKAGGEGVARFSAVNGAIVIKAKDQAPVVWALKVKNCAEAAIISFRNDECHLHLLEMKSKLTQGELAKALIQLEGMFLSALAVSRLLGVMQFSSTTCYVAYKEDALGANASADPVLMKTFVGMDNPIGGYQEWQSDSIDLPLSTVASLIKGRRDAKADVHFGEI